jgi:hypothetical protein
MLKKLNHELALIFTNTKIFYHEGIEEQEEKLKEKK